ncbi:Hypothetical protein AA314_06433 [Archangium gephyra]|uniref:Uncharacterized protein n=1 Tax=Archangium gephyra TaxID=48 RepID=A0AAC8QBR3_9BACT|nr:Hypothetical protein AA314_06433 [Archangium gephyra]
MPVRLDPPGVYSQGRARPFEDLERPRALPFRPAPAVRWVSTPSETRTVRVSCAQLLDTQTF